MFAGRWLGTRSQTDPEAQAVRDITEKYLMLRVEVNALTTLLTARGYFTVDDFEIAVIRECDYMQAALEKQFPGFKATDEGMHLDVAQAAQTTKGWPP